jgi:2-keto-4-pentenoate hydratase/2-oxohepta-3-ene-1,7-dioic acid hydratase in catechol pathway
MRLVRIKKDNEIIYGIINKGDINLIKGNIFSGIEFSSKYVKREEIKLLAPINPLNIIAIGLNYKKHANEGGHKYPDKPLIFLKATSSVIGPEDRIIIPEIAPNEVDYEAELAIVIGKTAKNIEVNEVEKYILGYTCANDVSARDCQQRLDKQWARGKSFDTFCPLGPWIETELDNPDHCKILSKLNGKVMQNSNTSDLIFSTKELVSYCSKNFTLYPGTVILTGTPEGVGFARNPQIFLKNKDIIEVEIEGIGKLSNQVFRKKF